MEELIPVLKVLSYIGLAVAIYDVPVRIDDVAMGTLFSIVCFALMCLIFPGLTIIIIILVIIFAIISHI